MAEGLGGGTQEQVRQLQSLIDALHDTLHCENLRDALDSIVAGVRRVAGEEVSAAITLISGSGGLDPSTYRVAGPQAEAMRAALPRWEGGIGVWVVQHGRDIYEEDVASGEADWHPAIRQDRFPVGAYACLPLTSKQRVVGTLFVLFANPYRFDQAARSSLDTFASMAGHVVGLFRLEAESRVQKERQTELVRQVGQQILKAWQRPDPEQDPGKALAETLAEILRQVEQEVFRGQEVSASIYIYDEGRGFYSGAARGPLAEYMVALPPRPGGTALYAVDSGKPLFVDDASNMPAGVPPLSQEASTHGVRALANLPLMVQRDGQDSAIGILIVNLRQPYHFDPDRQALLQLFADQAAIALQNARIHRRRVREQLALQAVGESAASGDPQLVGVTIAQQAVELTKAVYCTLWAADLPRRQLHLVGMHSEKPEWQPSPVLAIDDHSINGHVAQQLEEYYTDDLDHDPYYARWYADLTASFCVPLTIGSSLVGTLYVGSDDEQGIAPSDREFIRRLAPHAAVALHNVQLVDTLRRQKRDLDVLNQAAVELSSILETKDALKAVVDAVVRTLQCDYCGIFLPDPDDGTLVVSEGAGTLYDELPALRLTPGEGLAGWVYRQGSAVIVDDVTQDERYKPLKGQSEPKARSMILAPIIHEDRTIGVLSADAVPVGVFEQEDLQLMEILARQVGIVLKNIDLFDDLYILHDAAGHLARQAGLPQIYKATVEAAVQALRCTGSTLFEVDRVSGMVMPMVRAGRYQDIAETSHFALGEGLAGTVALSGEALLIRDTSQEERFVAGVHAPTEGPLSMLLVPIRMGDEVIGVLTADKEVVEGFGEYHQRTLELLAVDAGAAIALRRQQDRLEAIAEFQRRISALTSLEAAFQEIYDAARDALSGLMDTRNMYIALYDATADVIEFPLWFERGRLIPDEEKVPGHQAAPRQLKERRGLTGWVIEHQESQLIRRDFEAEAQRLGIEVYDIGTKCWLGAPMLLREEVIGVIGLQNFEREDVFDEDHRDLLMTIAGQAAIAVENARQYDEINNDLKRRIKELEAVSRFQSRVSAIKLRQQA